MNVLRGETTLPLQQLSNPYFRASYMLVRRVALDYSDLVRHSDHGILIPKLDTIQRHDSNRYDAVPQLLCQCHDICRTDICCWIWPAAREG